MPLQVTALGISDVGRKRKNNEDSFLVREDAGVYVVADGMGGHQAGEVASQRAVQIVGDHIARFQHVFKRLAEEPTQDHRTLALHVVQSAIQAACADIYAQATRNEGMRGMGTTLVCLVRAGSCAVIGHVGDSRIYLLRGGGVHQLTEDHTLYRAQLKHGIKDPTNLNKGKNVLTRAVGIQESVEVDTLFLELQSGDSFLLCSDGLHGYLEDAEIPALFSETDPDALPRRLIQLANDRGGKDNITAIVVRVHGGALGGEISAKVEFLRRLQLFQHLDYKEASAVLAIADTRVFPSNSVIVREGDDGEELFVVLRGQVAIESDDVEIAQLGPGGHFGEMGLIQNAPRSATVRSVEPTDAMVIHRTQMLELMRRDQTVAVKLLWAFVQVLSQRLRSTNSDLSEARHDLADFESRTTLVLPFPKSGS
ncbi:MAG: protein phosphatase 2C domain-containing protein [Deltaproteobacteria bacterium]|nr:protein phosphatase 2C domain-containing protein [Deltaproteobacteria bacterium]